MNPLLLVDSDILILLSGAELLDRVIELLGFTHERVRRLSALPHMLRSSKKLKQKFPEDFRLKVAGQVELIPSITERPSDEHLQCLSGIDGVDDGEAILFSILAENAGSLLVSGDLRSIRALAKSSQAEGIRNKIHNRVHCLETIVRLLIEADGVGSISQRFVPVRGYNAQLRIFFSDTLQTDQSQCLAGIDSYLQSIILNDGVDFLCRSK